MTALEQQAARAKEAGKCLAQTSSRQKDDAIAAIAAALVARGGEILEANARDLALAEGGGMSGAMLDRLTLTTARIGGMADGAMQVRALSDPVGAVLKTVTRPNGLVIEQLRVPFGLIGIIYEARPNVTADAAVLCLKAGNAVILRGGKEAILTNQAIAAVMGDALFAAGLPRDCVSLVTDVSRASADELMNLTAYVDVLIPRGGAGLIRHVAQTARVPVIRTGEGVCHLYVDAAANLAMAADILHNAKCSRPSVCNAVECVLVHEAVAAEFLPLAMERLRQPPVAVRGCPAVCAVLGEATPATDADWDAEYSDYILAAKVVKNAEEAMEFIALHGTGHSECIVTDDGAAAQRFLDAVDAAAVYWNASTRFTDGMEFGLGAEIGISTQKLHARGPMGLEALTSTKYVVRGDGQVR